ncbi:IPT/TIG domain-containing protein [Sinomonas sp. P10A9]|uniref:IPT/TIG domain-containing protein n=1 Tax=Sinomonas puerhi TaxID=3238584 RepID=A0AB39L2Y0_9MICC
MSGTESSMGRERVIHLLSDATILLWVVMAIVVGSIGFLIRFRFAQQKRSKDPKATSLTRPLLAMLLVGGILIFTAASIEIGSFGDLQKLLVGAIVSLAGSAVAYYFASSAADETRRDILGYSFGQLAVPNLKGKAVSEVQAVVAGTTFSLQLPSPSPDPNDIVISQDPPPGPVAGSARMIVVKTAPLPSIAKVDPGSGTKDGGTDITITGTGFKDATKVSFGDATTNIVSAGDTQVTIKSPKMPDPIKVDVTVTTPAGTSAINADAKYEFT